MLMVLLLAVFLPIVTMIIGAMWGRAYERSLWQGQLLHRSFRLTSEPGPAPTTDAVNAAQSRTGDPEHFARALDAIAEEVERISEGQRFLTRLLAERENGPARSANAALEGPVRPPNSPTT